MFFNDGKNRLYKTIIAVFLLATIFTVYWQTVGHEFISYDDPEYITDNLNIQQGFSTASIIWAFTSFHASNWHPLTWLSHILDVELFGMNPAGHHLVNIVLHSANSILLFILLNRYTGLIWRSAVVAALFALHPLHVESVAWASERKDVLSALFWMLTLYLYANYVQKGGRFRYFLTLTSFFLGLLAKPMLVTLPFILLMLDYWPLRRLDPKSLNDSIVSPKCSLKYLIKEKIPFILLVAVSCTITIYAQKAVMASVANTTVIARISNALTAYQFYLVKMILPQNQAVFYPYNHTLSPLQVSVAAIMLLAISIFAFKQRQTRPFIIVGWSWYILTLVPVIGIVQVGMQSVADRYSYIPLIGIFILITWGIADITSTWPYRRITLALLNTAVLAVCILTSRQQVSHWKNSTALFSHALNSTDKNFIAHFLLGCEFEKQDRMKEAVSSYKAALADNRFYGPIYGKLGKISYESRDLDDAIDYYYKELFVTPLSVTSRNNLGIALAEKGRFDEAIGHFSHALALKPDFIEAENNLKRAIEMKRTSGK